MNAPRPVSTAARHAPNAAPGFSLMELMLVIAIIGVLTAVVAYNVTGAGSKAKRRVTITSMLTIKNAINQYNLDHSSFPPALSALVTGKYLDDTIALKDGWSNEFFYSPVGLNDKAYQFVSLGEDKTAGTPDDIDVWTMQK